MAAPLRVLLVCSKYPPEYSGSGHRLHRTYGRLAKKFGVQWDVLCGSVAENRSARYTHEGVSVTRMACKPFPISGTGPSKRDGLARWLALKAGRRLALFVNYWCEALPAFLFLWRHRGYDALHVAGSNAVTSAALIFGRVTGAPLVYEIVNETTRPFPYRPFLLSWLDSASYQRRIPVVCISERLRDMCRRHGLGENLWCRPNPVDEERFFVDRSQRDAARAASPFGPLDKVVAYVSLFIPRKNQIFLVDVLARLPEQFKLFLAGPVVGQGPNQARDRRYVDEIRRRVAALGLEKRVFIQEGFVERTDLHIKMADVFAFPTTDEGLGTPMLESLACGVPVVASRLPGVTDVWVRDGYNGYVEDLEPAAFAEKIRMAAGLSAAGLDESAGRVRARAGTRAIDRMYEALLRSTAAGRPVIPSGTSAPPAVSVEAAS